MKRSFLIALVFLSAPLLLSARSVWEGSGAVGTYGSLPSTGLYGASDSFPQNTLVTVENVENNKKATVLIIDRLNDNGLFMLLSKDAGAAIGLTSGQVAQVRVTLAKQISSASHGPGDLPYSIDPDVFPAAGAGNPTSLSFLDRYLKPTQPSSSSSTPEATPQPNLRRLQATPSSQAVPPPQPKITANVPPSSKTIPEGSAGSASQEVPTETGIKKGSVPTSLLETARSTTVPPVPTGPRVAGLEPSAAPSRTPPIRANLAEPVVPEKAGSPPISSPLQSVPTPRSAMQLTMAGRPAMPEIRNPGPTATGVAAAAPPTSSAVRTTAADLPRVPEGTPSGPQVSRLAQARPTGAGRAVVVSTVPSVPKPPPSVAIELSAPLMSTLAEARPPHGRGGLSAAELPLPEIGRLAPEVTRLASGRPSAEKTIPARAAEVPTVPPSEVGGKPVTAAVTAGRIPVRPSSALVSASYYLQLGAYGESSVAVALADNLSPDYPVSVYAFKQNKKSLYKVMIGPLNSDESGTLLYLFTAQGYKGAFVRKGE